MLALWFVLQAREKRQTKGAPAAYGTVRGNAEGEDNFQGGSRRTTLRLRRIYGRIYRILFSVPKGPITPRYMSRGRDSLADYLKKPSKYRRTGIIFMLIGLGVMMFFLSLGSNTPWGLGIIPMFIGFAYLYLDYSNAKSVEERKQMEEFLRYKRERGVPSMARERRRFCG